MARPGLSHPTPAELEVLHVLWEHGPSTVRETLESLKTTRRRAYTTIMSLLNVMTDKGLVNRRRKGRAYVYAAAAGRTKTVERIVSDLVLRAFDGSASALVAHLLDNTPPSSEELKEIRRLIKSRRSSKGGAT